MKYIYINKNLRVKVTYNSYGKILLKLYSKNFLFWTYTFDSIKLIVDEEYNQNNKDYRPLDIYDITEVNNLETLDIKKSAFKLARKYLDVIDKQKKAKKLISQLSIIMMLFLFGCKKKTPPINYQSQLDSLSGVIATKDAIIKNMVADLDSLIELKENVRYVQGKRIIIYKTTPTPQRVQQLAERL